MADIDDISEKLNRVLERLAELGAVPAPEDDGEPISEEDIKERLGELQALLKQVTGKDIDLTPVNAWLGETVGKLLNGKKTGIGIIGSLAATLLGNSQAASPLGRVAEGATSFLPFMTGMSGPLMPVFLAMTAWGVLGKMEKWSLGKH